MVHLYIGFFLAQLLAGIGFNVFHLKRLVLFNRLEKRKAIETVRLHTQFPVFPTISHRRFRQAANTQSKRQHTNHYFHFLVHFLFSY